MPLLGAVSRDRLAQLARLLSIDPRFAGKGLQFDIGAVYPLTGPGSIYGNRFSDVPKMAFRHIEALGGPHFNLVMKDNKSGDPQSGVDDVRELGFAKVPMCLSSYAADLGSMIPGIAQYRMLSIDGSGGTSLFAQHKPYFWGAIAITPNDAIGGAARYIAAKMPHVRRIAFVGWDLGELSDMVAADMRKRIRSGSYELVADERTAIGETDYGAALEKVKIGNPDLVFMALYAEDVGYFAKQYATSGIGKPVFGFSHTDAAAKIAGAAYEGLYFAFDYFDANRPANPWARFFIDEFKAAEGGGLPDYYSANTYEDVFIFWECIRRVLKAGGNPKLGQQLNAALQARPVFPSLYGGSASAAGQIAFNPLTHSLTSRPMSVSQYRNGQVTPLAFFNIGGAGFRLA